jgi:hypothetical protein
VIATGADNVLQCGKRGVRGESRMRRNKRLVDEQIESFGGCPSAQLGLLLTLDQDQLERDTRNILPDTVNTAFP